MDPPQTSDFTAEQHCKKILSKHLGAANPRDVPALYNLPKPLVQKAVERGRAYLAKTLFDMGGPDLPEDQDILTTPESAKTPTELHRRRKRIYRELTREVRHRTGRWQGCTAHTLSEGVEVRGLGRV